MRVNRIGKFIGVGVLATVYFFLAYCAASPSRARPVFGEQGSGKKESFSQELRRKHPTMWEIYRRYVKKHASDCVEDDGVYRCGFQERGRMFYDSRTGKFGIETRF